MRIEFFFQQNYTKIINFDEGILILWQFFWGNVIFKICYFCLKSHNRHTVEPCYKEVRYNKTLL